jgi:hypothetical protein
VDGRGWGWGGVGKGGTLTLNLHVHLHVHVHVLCVRDLATADSWLLRVPAHALSQPLFFFSVTENEDSEEVRMNMDYRNTSFLITTGLGGPAASVDVYGGSLCACSRLLTRVKASLVGWPPLHPHTCSLFSIPAPGPGPATYLDGENIVFGQVIGRSLLGAHSADSLQWL